jgi:hypothetical protein
MTIPHSSECNIRHSTRSRSGGKRSIRNDLLPVCHSVWYDFHLSYYDYCFVHVDSLLISPELGGSSFKACALQRTETEQAQKQSKAQKLSEAQTEQSVEIDGDVPSPSQEACSSVGCSI